MKHTCKALVLHCIDFRFGVAIKQYLEKNNLLDDCDIVSIAGAAKNIANPTTETDRKFIMRQIDISKRLHEIKEVILMNHTDCGAYGGRSAFQNREEEEQKHFEDMHTSADMIKAAYPELAVATILANIEDSGDIHFDTQKA